MGTKLKANILHHDFNPCGGAERVSFATMQAISKMGIDFDITTYTEPDLLRIVNAYGKDQASIITSTKKLNVVTSFQNPSIKNNVGDEYDIYINTHPDLFPFYQDHFARRILSHIATFLWQDNTLNLKMSNILEEISEYKTMITSMSQRPQAYRVKVKATEIDASEWYIVVMRN